LAPGGNLKEIIDNKETLNQDEIMSFFTMILLALNYLQIKKVMHRDLKPENIMINNLPGGLKIMKLVDFGLSKEENNSKSVTLDMLTT
jgi:serine/threonine protein kinase